MKKNILTITILSILFLGIIFNPITINADSGFDASYDSSSSSSSSNGSNSFENSSNRNNHYNNSISLNLFDYITKDDIINYFITFSILMIISLTIAKIIKYIYYKYFKHIVDYFLIQNNKIITIITIILIIIIVISIILFLIYILFKNKILNIEIIGLICAFILSFTIYKFIKNQIKSLANKLKNHLNLKYDKNINNKHIINAKNKLQNNYPNLNLKKFNKLFFNNYKKIQIAWMNYNLESIKNIVSDELFNMYSMQLETLKIKNEQNIMKNIKYIDSYIIDYSTTNNIETIEQIMIVKCQDYIIKKDTNKIVKGNKFKKRIYKYKLTFQKNHKIIKNCPNCGSTISVNNNKCQYCNSIIINNEQNWVLSKKEMLEQLYD